MATTQPEPESTEPITSKRRALNQQRCACSWLHLVLEVELEKLPCHQLHKKAVGPREKGQQKPGPLGEQGRETRSGGRMHGGLSCLHRRVWLGPCLRQELLRAGNKLWQLLSRGSLAREMALPAIATLGLMRSRGHYEEVKAGCMVARAQKCQHLSRG